MVEAVREADGVRTITLAGVGDLVLEATRGPPVPVAVGEVIQLDYWSMNQAFWQRFGLSIRRDGVLLWAAESSFDERVPVGTPELALADGDDLCTRDSYSGCATAHERGVVVRLGDGPARAARPGEPVVLEGGGQSGVFLLASWTRNEVSPDCFDVPGGVYSWVYGAAAGGTVACGELHCDAATHYCRQIYDCVSPEPTRECVPLPEGCGGVGSCACLADEYCGDLCEATGAGFTLTCPGG